jgi:hypothetical protein
MLRKISTLALVTLALLSVDAQKNKNTQYNDGVERPKLVVGIVVTGDHGDIDEFVSRQTNRKMIICNHNDFVDNIFKNIKDMTKNWLTTNRHHRL